MKIFKTENLFYAVQDWLSSNAGKLGCLSWIGASRERWFQFELGTMFLDKWEYLIYKPWNDWDLWIEAAQPGKRNQYIDITIAPTADENNEEPSIKWRLAGIIEIKTHKYELKKNQKFIGILNSIKGDFQKRKELQPSEMLGISLIHHTLPDSLDTEYQKTGNDQQIRELLNDNLASLKSLMKKNRFRIPQKVKSIPSVWSVYRGARYGFFSCAVWIQE